MSNNINRRDFLKVAGAGIAGSGIASLPGCSSPADEKHTTAEGRMEYRTAPDGNKISLLGYGCMRWPMIKGEDGKDVIDQNAVNEMVDYAYKHGVNYYDTSPAYLQGQSEAAAGTALSRYPRDTYYLATKLSNFNVFTREASLKMYYDSMEQLRTEYFDYYLLHAIGGGGVKVFNDRYVDNGMMDFMLKEREAGRIRHLGFSFHGKQEAFDEFMKLHDKYHWDFVQIEMNYLDWEHAKAPSNVNADYLYEELDKREIPVTVMEPLLGGRLASLPENLATKLKERKPDKSVASWAFRFAGTYPRVLTVLSGMTCMDHIIDNVETYSHFEPLNDSEIEFLKMIAGLMSDYPTVGCTNCKYCMPCPYGIDIPGVFKHYNSCVNEGTIPQSREQEQFKKLKRAYLVSYDRAVETVRQADHCISCGQCVSHCPQSIKIPHELQRIAAYVERLRQEKL